MGFRPGALPAGVTLRPESGEEWSLAAFWVHAPPCYVVTMARAEGGQKAHEALLDALLSASIDGSAGGGAGGSNSGSSSPCMTSGGSASSPRSKSRASPLLSLQQRTPPPAAPITPTAKEPLLQEGTWPVSVLATDGFLGYAQQAVERCVQEGRCTFAATGASWMPQVRCCMCGSREEGSGYVGQ